MYTDSGQDYQINKRAGFSLIELMVVVIIIAITAAIAIPNMSGWFGKKTLDSISLQMFSDFQRARSEALTRDRTIKIDVHMNPDWYKVVYTTNGTDIDIVPQTNMPQGVDIQKTTFPLSVTANTTWITPQGFANPGGYVTIYSNNAPLANRNKTITLSLGGAVSITP